MKSISNYVKLISAMLLIGVLQSISGCNNTPPEPEPVVKEPIKVWFQHAYDNKYLEYQELYKSAQENDLWVTQIKYYVSNVVAIKTDGNRELIADVAIIDHSLGIPGLTISGNIPPGNYKSISFDLGVREDLNKNDPATYPSDHPLSVTQNMYWGWSTQYIFSKCEGFEIANGDTFSYVIHTGTQDLYRPEVTVSRNFTVAKGGIQVSVNMNLYTLFKQSEYTFDLTKDGQSHTTDNLDLAVQYMDNFSNAFN